MSRDITRDKEYFVYLIKDEDRRIAKFGTLIHQVIQERGEDDPGAKTAYNYIYGMYFNRLKAMYSAGCSLGEIKSYIPNVLNIMEKSWDIDSGYVEMIWMLSIGIMLEVKREEMDRLTRLVKKSGVKDYLIDFLICSYDDDHKIATSHFKWKEPYGFLEKILNEDNKETAIKLLENYLNKQWYKGHDDMDWYDTHKAEDEYLYSGYWSFESGAIVKILGLSDDVLQGVRYYPYDLVHFNDK
ncbi:PoNe immunity protein domain-containing protein [Priestia endophytica]|uniref:PoNe immunity protein domain-containing protein n=1 Tax=Priestia endophytica TaxID=135735 RepID=UPI0022831EF5|nr:PoNe immunity protein domain-containing protein [Priestia endophytica]MCY8232261.1 PoNi-like cognate immunity protein [Priestia endophytica]